MIVKSGKNWILKSHDGEKVLGKFDSEKAAKERLRQIEYFKNVQPYGKK